MQVPGIGRMRMALMTAAASMCSQMMKSHPAALLPATVVWCKFGYRQGVELVGRAHFVQEWRRLCHIMFN